MYFHPIHTLYCTEMYVLFVQQFFGDIQCARRRESHVPAPPCHGSALYASARRLSLTHYFLNCNISSPKKVASLYSLTIVSDVILLVHNYVHWCLSEFDGYV